MGYLGHRTGSTDAGSSSVTIDKPTECTEGSWLFALLNSNLIEGTHTLTPPEGWTLVDDLGSSSTSSTKSHAHIFRKKVAAEDAGASGALSYTFAVDPNRTFGATIICYDGLDPDNPVAGVSLDSDGGVSNTSISCGDVTTTGDHQFVIRAATIRATATFTQLTGYTERVDFQPPVSNYSVNWQETTQSVAGATGAATITASAVGQHIGITLVLNRFIETLRPDAILENTEPSETPAGRSNATLLTDLQRDVV